MRPPLRLAPEVGTQLARGEILLGPLSWRVGAPSPGEAIAMTILQLVLGDQLSFDLTALADIDPAADVVLMLEVEQEGRQVPHYQRKIVLFLSAMRHFAAALTARGLRVDYVTLDDCANTGTFTGEMEHAVARHAPERLVLPEPGEWRVQAMVEG